MRLNTKECDIVGQCLDIKYKAYIGGYSIESVFNALAYNLYIFNYLFRNYCWRRRV